MANRMLKLGPFVTSLMLLALVAPPMRAGDWPQWRGPNRDGVSSETIALWKSTPPVIWETPAGEAHASPVVAAGKVFVLEKSGTNEAIRALDAQKGDEKWRHAYPCTFANVYGNGPRATPTYSNGKLYSLGARGDLVCLDAETGAVVWKLNLLEKFNATNLFFGTSGSPLVHDGMVLVMAGGKGAGLVALDAKTGETRWTSQDDRASYASPIIFNGSTAPQAVFLTQRGLVAVRPKDGGELWRLPLVTFNDENAVTPVPFGNLVIGTSVSYGAIAMAVKGDTASKTWQTNAFSSYFSSPVIANNLLFAVTGTPAVLKCLDPKTGEEKWKHATVGLLHASLLVAGENLLIQGDTGSFWLIKPSSSGFEQLAKAKLCGPGWISPALSDGRLYIRDGKSIKCVAVK